MEQLTINCTNGQRKISVELAEMIPVFKMQMNEQWKKEDTFTIDSTVEIFDLIVKHLTGNKIEQTSEFFKLCEFLDIKFEINELDDIIEAIEKDMKLSDYFDDFIIKPIKISKKKADILWKYTTQCKKDETKEILKITYGLISELHSIYDAKHERSQVLESRTNEYKKTKLKAINHSKCETIIYLLNRLMDK